MRMISNRSFPYANRQLRAEDEFEASDGDARLLTLLGNARYANEADIPKRPRKKRRYKRRDQQAETA